MLTHPLALNSLEQLVADLMASFIAFLSEWLPILVHGLLGFIP
jgi:hypothetical protein